MSVDLSKDNDLKKIFISAFTRSIKVVQNKVKRRTPVKEGILRNSVFWELQELSDTRVEFFIGSNTEYAPHVEFGWVQERVTQDGRPYTISYNGAFMFQRGIEASRSSIETIINNAVRKAMRGSKWRFLEDFGAKFD